jgi:signal transduction histidine kinase
VVLESDLPVPGLRFSANAGQIKQVLTVLVTNAWEAGGDAGGKIRLSIRTVAAANISTMYRFPIDCHPSNSVHACLEVSDAGCGISGSDIEKIFDPFFSSKSPGRGMGLAVVLGIIRAHDGVITVESEAGSGATFRVFLPVTGGNKL